MNPHIFIFTSLFISFFTQKADAIDRLDVKAAWKNKNYSKIISISEKYPSLFSSGDLPYYLAQSLFQSKQIIEAASVCFKSAIQEKHQGCYTMLREIRESSPREYRFGLGKAHFDLGDMRKSFRAFYTLIDEDPQDLRARYFLIKIFQYLQERDLVWEQLQYIREPSKELRTYSEKIRNQVSNIGNRLRKNPSLLQEKWESGIYLYVIASENPELNAISFLKELYQRRIAKEPDLLNLRLRLANLFFAEKRFENVTSILDELQKEPLTAQLNLSLESLKSRMSLLQKGENLRLKAKTPSPIPQTSASHLDALSKNKDISSKRISEVKSLNLKPIDLSELPLARPSDLSPIHRVESAIRARLEKANSDYEKRYLIKEIDRAENELLMRETSAEALNSYMKTEKGKAMSQLVAQYEKAFEPVDQKNSKQFVGEYGRFQKAISSSKSEKERKRVLQGFLDRWWRLSEGEGVNLLNQGALKAYSESIEGKKLAREVYKLGLELKLNPTNLKLGEAFFQDRGF